MTENENFQPTGPTDHLDTAEHWRGLYMDSVAVGDGLLKERSRLLDALRVFACECEPGSCDQQVKPSHCRFHQASVLVRSSVTDPEHFKTELPGMWEEADLIGGETDCV